MVLVLALTVAASAVRPGVANSGVPTSPVQSASEPNPLSRALRIVFSQRNPAVTRVTVLELRSVGMGAGPYVLLGWGIR